MESTEGIELKPVADEAANDHLANLTTSNELGAFHTDADAQVSGSGTLGPAGPLPKANLGEFLNRFTKIQVGSMATTDVALTSLMLVDPWTLFLADGFIASKTETYRFIRSTLEVQISVNAPAGAYGLYVLIAAPLGVSMPAGINAGGGMTVESCLALPHVLIDLSAASDGRISLPWVHWNDYAAIHDTTTNEGVANMWQLRLWCLQPLGTGTGTVTPVATFRIWARCAEDVDMVIPYSQGFDDLRKSVNKTSQNLFGAKPSGIASAIASTSSAVGAVAPFLAPLTTPVAFGAGAVKSVLSYFGFTRSAEQQTPTLVVDRPFSNVANMDCIDTSEIAALSNANAISIDPGLSSHSHEDESSFDYIFQKWGLIGTVSWAPTDAAEDELIMYPVSPFVSRFGMTTGACFPPVGFVGFPFQYWRGTMEYRIIIPISKFHRGVLQVSWTPVPTVSTTDITNTQYNHVLDIGTCSDWTFTVGYAAARPVLDNIPHLFGAAILSTFGANGAVRISVVNPLTSQVETASTRIFVFARALPDMDFSVPRSVMTVLEDDGTLSTRDFITGFRIQGKALGDEVQQTKSFVLVPHTSLPVKDVVSGETVRSVRALMQKPSLDMNLSTSISKAGFLGRARTYFPHIPPFTLSNMGTAYEPPVADSGELSQWFTWFGYYSSLFVGVAGSTRVKLFNVSTETLAIGASHMTTVQGLDFTSTAQKVSTVNPIWCPPRGDGVEITIPYYFRHKYIPTFNVWTASNILNGAVDSRIDVIETPILFDSDSRVAATCYTAAGPDLRLHMYRFARAIISATPNDEWEWYPYWIPPS